MNRGNKAGKHFSHLTAGASKAIIDQFTGEHGWERCLHFYEQDDYLLDLSCLKYMGRLGEVIFDGALMYCNDKRRETVGAIRTSIGYFSRYVGWLIRRKEIPPMPTPCQLTPALFAGFASWLKNRAQSGLSFSTQTAAITYGHLASALRFCIPKYNTEFGSNFAIASNPLEHSQHIETLFKKAQPLQLYDYKAVQDAARKDALAIINDPSRPDFPKSRAHLLPFYLLLLLGTCTNPSSAASLRRDCLERHPFENGVWLIHFSKPRAGSGEEEEYTWFDSEDNDPLTPLNVIRFLLGWTSQLMDSNSTPHNRVLVYSVSSKSKIKKVRVYRLQQGWKSNRYDDATFLGFAKKHNLPPFTAQLLRESAAYHKWLRTGSTWEVKNLLNHKHFITTGRYLLGKGILEVANTEIADGAAKMTEAYIKGRPIVREKTLADIVFHDLRLDDPIASKVIAGEWHTGLGECANPMNSPMPRQTPDKLCTAFWACIFCPRAIIAIEHLPLLIAHQASVRAQDRILNAATWKARYGNIDSRLTQIIGDFSESAQNNAREKVASAHLSLSHTEVTMLLKTPLTY